MTAKEKTRLARVAGFPRALKLAGALAGRIKNFSNFEYDCHASIWHG
jgi:hypothetical protein